jgi:hypothetical protein
MWDGAFPDMPITHVTVSFREVDGGTELELRQDDLSLRVCAQHLSGWMDAFVRLSVQLQLGNKNVNYELGAEGPRA